MHLVCSGELCVVDHHLSLLRMARLADDEISWASEGPEGMFVVAPQLITPGVGQAKSLLEGMECRQGVPSVVNHLAQRRCSRRHEVVQVDGAHAGRRLEELDLFALDQGSDLAQARRASRWSR